MNKPVARFIRLPVTYAAPFVRIPVAYAARLAQLPVAMRHPLQCATPRPIVRCLRGTPRPTARAYAARLVQLPVAYAARLVQLPVAYAARLVQLPVAYAARLAQPGAMRQRHASSNCPLLTRHPLRCATPRPIVRCLRGIRCDAPRLVQLSVAYAARVVRLPLVILRCIALRLSV